MFQITHALYNNRDRPNVPPSLSAKPPTPTPTNAPTFDRTTPKCYPETATVYFLPAPPSSPKITVLNPNKNDIPSLKQNVKNKPLNIFQEVPATFPLKPPSEMSKRVAFPPPPPCTTGLPDLMDEIPTKTQERISRLAESEEMAPVCESCAAVIKLPIFNFDQELLDGFLAGIGI